MCLFSPDPSLLPSTTSSSSPPTPDTKPAVLSTATQPRTVLMPQPTLSSINPTSTPSSVPATSTRETAISIITASASPTLIPSANPTPSGTPKYPVRIGNAE